MYFVKGADQKEYGPVSNDQIRQWIAENRLNQFSVARKDGESAWKPLGQFEEFSGLFPGAASAATPMATPPPQVAYPTVQPVPPGSNVASVSSGSSNHLGPAIGMIVTGALSALLSVVNIGVLAINGSKKILESISKFGGGAAFPEELLANMTTGMYAMYGLQFILGLIIIIGGISFLRLKNRGLAMTGAVIMVIPCCGTASILCALGVPLGAWALTVLSKPDTRDAFLND